MSLLVDQLVLNRSDGVRLLGPLSLHLAPGDRVGLAGESGSGKTLLVQALFGALPPGVRREGGTVAWGGVPLENQGPTRGVLPATHLAWVPQDPGQALNPLMTLGEHLALLPGVFLREDPAASLARLCPLLDRLGLPWEATFLARFPHQLSGGQRQRIVLAMALSCDPEGLVLDEPTTALDPLAQRDFLELVLGLQRERNLSFLWISHDLALLAQACDRLLVMYGGEIMESGPTVRLLGAPQHPCTARLVAAARLEPTGEDGFLPAPQERPAGCPFLTRCPSASGACATWGPWQGMPGHGIRCEHPLPLPARFSS